MATTSFLAFWTRLVEHVRSLADHYDGQWQKRRRRIDTMTVALTVCKLVMANNSKGYGSALAEVWEDARNFLAGTKPVAASSFCEARAKVSERFFRLLHGRIIQAADKTIGRAYLWHGRRVFCVDGSKVSLPRHLLNCGYPVPAKGYYPQGLVSTLYQLESKLPYDFALVKHGDERACAHAHLKCLGYGDLVVYDRGYFSFALAAAHLQRHVAACFRLAGRTMYKAIDDFMKSRAMEKIVWICPQTKQGIQNCLTRHPGIKVQPLPLRLIKYKVKGAVHCLATTLLSKRRFPRKCFADLYHGRWGVEELYKTSKRIIEVEDFHGKSERGVKQELYAHFALLALARLLANQVEATLLGTEMPHLMRDRLDRPVRVNFKNVIATLARHIIDLLLSQTHERLQGILEAIARLHYKRRPGRSYPRRSRRPFRRWMPQAHVSQPA